MGIGGIGMSGIAELLANLGYRVSGSDAKASAVTARLADARASTSTKGTPPSTSATADVVVVSSAIRPLNPEVIEARRRHVPVIPRAEMLAELMRLRFGIAVAGAHGKTSTTSMIAHLLERAGLDPTAVIGGKLSTFGSNARLGPRGLHGGGGRRERRVVPAALAGDRASSPTSIASTSITTATSTRVCAAFVEFANKVPFYGAVIACVDDPPLRALVPRFTRRVDHLRPRQPATRTCAARTCALEAGGSTCRVVRRAGRAGARRTRSASCAWRCPGRHNLLNALAAVAVALELEVPFARVPRRRSRSSAAPTAASRCSASSTASRSSTTTDTIRRRSPRCSARAHGR